MPTLDEQDLADEAFADLLRKHNRHAADASPKCGLCGYAITRRPADFAELGNGSSNSTP